MGLLKPEIKRLIEEIITATEKLHAAETEFLRETALTQSQVGDLIGASQPFIAQVVAGKKHFSFEHWGKILDEEIPMKKTIKLSATTLEMVDALADHFEVPEAFNGQISDESRDKAIRVTFEKLLRESGNEHLITSRS